MKSVEDTTSGTSAFTILEKGEHGILQPRDLRTAFENEGVGTKLTYTVPRPAKFDAHIGDVIQVYETSCDLIWSVRIEEIAKDFLYIKVVDSYDARTKAVVVTGEPPEIVCGIQQRDGDVIDVIDCESHPEVEVTA